MLCCTLLREERETGGQGRGAEGEKIPASFGTGGSGPCRAAPLSGEALLEEAQKLVRLLVKMMFVLA